MSTLATAALDSDSEDDLNFVPSTSKPKSKFKAKPKSTSGDKRTRSPNAGSSSGGEASGFGEEENKRMRLDQNVVDERERHRRATEAFKSMVEDSAGLEVPRTAQGKERGMVEIQRARTFAGETIYETVSVPADDPEAIAFLAQGRDPTTNGNGRLKAGDMTQSVNDDQDRQTAEASAQPSTSSAQANTHLPSGPSSSSSTSTPRSTPKSPIRRKPRQSLEEMSAALSKGKRMTTLEKSQLDWKSHTNSDTSVHAELEANRRTGGYLEKRDFLDRVGERRMETFDSKKEKDRGRR